ncbi:MAG: DUF3788 domain-containing protein [Christensenellales bacterium]|jgi:hypothetical protein
MPWHEVFDRDHPPTMAQIDDFISSDLWAAFTGAMSERYGAKPKMSYSNCSWQKGWNIKYKKGGRSLGTYYPMEGFFIGLVTVSEKDQAQADLLMPAMDEHVRSLYNQSVSAMGGKWLMIHVTDKKRLEDLLQLLDLKAGQ